MNTEPTAADEIAGHLARREASWAQTFADTAPDADADASVILAYIDASLDRFGFVPDDEQAAIIAAYRAAVAAETVSEEDTEKLADVLSAIETETEDRRRESIDEDILGLGVVVSIRIELSTGGPGDYVTADIDRETRSASNVRYHFVPWFDHADVPVSSDSPLVQLVDYYAETIDLDGDGE